jgi:hypothetical protein
MSDYREIFQSYLDMDDESRNDIACKCINNIMSHNVIAIIKNELKYNDHLVKYKWFLGQSFWMEYAIKQHVLIRVSAHDTISCTEEIEVRCFPICKFYVNYS